jgi:hypothetical protein
MHSARKFACWKMPTSYGGRLTLVKAIHAALPIFQMIALKYPECTQIPRGRCGMPQGTPFCRGRYYHPRQKDLYVARAERCCFRVWGVQQPTPPPRHRPPFYFIFSF